MTHLKPRSREVNLGEAISLGNLRVPLQEEFENLEETSVGRENRYFCFFICFHVETIARFDFQENTQFLKPKAADQSCDLQRLIF